MIPLDDPILAATRYAAFADQARGSSEVFTRWAGAIAEDDEVLALVEGLPEPKQQPNLVLAAARWHGAVPGPYDGLRTILVEQWDAVRETVMARATQTNEPGRCATLLPTFARLAAGRPLALLEVGTSAGLCLAADRYSYDWSGTRLDPPSGPSPVVLSCATEGVAPPSAMPQVVWRAGIDLHPLDVRDDDAMRWLQTLVWPEHDDRRARLAGAIDLARTDPPRIVTGDLNDALPALAAEAPDDAVLVVFHSAVLAYLSAADRTRFVETVRGLPGHGTTSHWVSNEGPSVVPGVDVPPAPTGSVVGSSPFLLCVDGEPAGWTEGHGRALLGLPVGL